MTRTLAIIAGSLLGQRIAAAAIATQYAAELERIANDPAARRVAQVQLVIGAVVGGFVAAALVT